MKGRPGERERAEGLRKGKRTPSRGKCGMSPRETRRYRRRMKHQTQPLNYLIHSAYPHLSYLFVTGFEVSLHVLQFKIFYESTKKRLGFGLRTPFSGIPAALPRGRPSAAPPAEHAAPPIKHSQQKQTGGLRGRKAPSRPHLGPIVAYLGRRQLTTIPRGEGHSSLCSKQGATTVPGCVREHLSRSLWV